MGCDKIRLKVPLFCSELMASKPKAIPNSGPRKLTKTVKEGKVPSLTVNSLRKRTNRPDHWVLSLLRCWLGRYRAIPYTLVR